MPYMIKKLVVEVKLLHPNFKNGTWKVPTYGSDGAAAFDLIAAIDEEQKIWPNETVMIPSGIAVSIMNPNYVLLLAPRSGKGCKEGLKLGNTFGVIDSDYQGEIMLCVKNDNAALTLHIKPGERIVQGILIEKTHAAFSIVDEFSTETERGAGGFGSTGKH